MGGNLSADKLSIESSVLFAKWNRLNDRVQQSGQVLIGWSKEREKRERKKNPIALPNTITFYFTDLDRIAEYIYIYRWFKIDAE